ncbi:MAG: thiol reductant ABC exporter subunit CydC [Solirubrobacteraceae bacterium]
MTRAERRALRRVVAIAPPRGRLAVATVACAAAAVLASVALLAVSGTLISKAALRPPVLSLGVLIVAVRALALVRALARYGERLASHDLALRALARLRAGFFARLVARRPRHRGDLLSRFVADVDRLQDLYLRALTPPLVAALCATVTVLAAWVLVPAAALALLGGLIVAGIAVPWAGARVNARAARRSASVRARLSAAVLEAARHGAELAVLGQGHARAAALAAADARLARLARRDAQAAALVSAAAGGAQGAAVIGALVAGIGATTAGSLDGILLAGLVLLTLGAFDAVAPLPAAAISLGGCASAAERVTAACDAPPAVAEPDRPVALPPGGALEVRAATVRLEPGGPAILDALDLSLAEGEVVALVGASGAGKTTLAELLARFADPEAGSVRLGGVDLRRVHSADVRRAVRLVAQDAGLFTTTIAENVRLARPSASDAEVRRALDAVGLGPWLDSLPAGERTVAGEDGVEVSGGQRRRIALARALLADARTLIVDEPTAHLDPATARLVLDALCAHARATGRGLLAIVHPGSDLSGFDRVLELRGGRLAAAAGR